MPDRALYTPHHPRWLRHRVSTWWWLGRWSYFAFILRELSSIFIAWFVVFLLLLVRAIGAGDMAYRQFLDWSGRPLVLVVNVVTLLFVLLHAVTWFNLAPKAMVVHVGSKRLPGALIAIANYGAWVVVTGGIAWLLLGGTNG